MVDWIEKHEALVAARVAKLRCGLLLRSARGPRAPRRARACSTEAAEQSFRQMFADHGTEGLARALGSLDASQKKALLAALTAGPAAAHSDS